VGNARAVGAFGSVFDTPAWQDDENGDSPFPREMSANGINGDLATSRVQSPFFSILLEDTAASTVFRVLEDPHFHIY
jgi:hypothetical protein